MNSYDLQVHTDASPCSAAAPADVVDAAASAGLDGVAITNHDTLEGYEAAAAAAPPSLDVVSGVEVTTDQGHLLAIDVPAVPEPGDPLAVVDRVHDLGGVAVLSHPFDRLREHYDERLQELARRVDAVEVTNSRCLLPRYADRAREYAETHSLPATAGSDAHFPMEVGRAYTICDGDVVEAIRRGKTRPAGRGGYVSGHVATKFVDLRRAIGR